MKNESKEKNISQMLSEIILELIFPARCPVCDRVLGIGERICPGCRERLRVIQSPFCKKCGKKLEENSVEEYCRDCRDGYHLYKEGRALYEYPCVRDAIYRFKYRGRREYASFYGEELARYLGRYIKNWNADGLVPVPLHKSKMRQRGYNQAQILAEVLGKHLHMEVYPDYIQRVKKTVPQKNLDKGQRQNNLKKAFKIVQNDVKLKILIIVDDIYTTGSTIDAMAEIMLAGGVQKVYYIALAIGKG